MENEESWLLNEKYNGEKTEGFFADLTLLNNGVPLAYLIGYIPFLNTRIHLDSHPLIPRPETEYWVEHAITEIRNFIQNKQSNEIKILDLCAGSGCIGVAVLKAIPEARVDFIEIEERHHATIQKNISENDIDESRARIYGGSLFDSTEETYDFILTNPPYIDPKLSRTELSVLTHEPHVALFGGENGTVLINQIIEGSQEHLTNAGVLYIEHEPEQVNEICSVAEKNTLQAETCKDQYGVLRFTRLTRKVPEFVG